MKYMFVFSFAALLAIAGSANATYNKTFASVGHCGSVSYSAAGYQTPVFVQAPITLTSYVYQVPVVQVPVAACNCPVQVSTYNAPSVPVAAPAPPTYQNVAQPYTTSYVSAPVYSSYGHNVFAANNYGHNAFAVNRFFAVNNHGYNNVNFAVKAAKHNVAGFSSFAFVNSNRVNVSRRPSLVAVNLGRPRNNVAFVNVRNNSQNNGGTVVTTTVERRGLFGGFGPFGRRVTVTEVRRSR